MGKGVAQAQVLHTATRILRLRAQSIPGGADIVDAAENAARVYGGLDLVRGQKACYNVLRALLRDAGHDIGDADDVVRQNYKLRRELESLGRLAT